MNVEHDESGSRFVIRFDGDDAYLVYAMAGRKLIDLQHTYVPESARGHGAAEALAMARTMTRNDTKREIMGESNRKSLMGPAGNCHALPQRPRWAGIPKRTCFLRAQPLRRLEIARNASNAEPKSHMAPGNGTAAMFVEMFICPANVLICSTYWPAVSR